MCLAQCTNVECACTPPDAELQRSADENIRGRKHRVLHSARHSARPQNTVNTTYFPKNNQEPQKKKIFL